jgi:hypothetical protein
MKHKHHLLFSALLLGGLASSPAFAADTVCSIVYMSEGSPIAVEVTADNIDDIGEDIPEPVSTIAVASNFYQPAIDLVKEFLLYSATGTPSYNSVGVCHNATGHLVEEITGTETPSPTEWWSNAIQHKYSIFLAANASAPINLALSADPIYTYGCVQSYAEGIPALLRNPISKGSASSLVVAGSGTPSGFFYGDHAQPTGQVKMNVSVIDPIAIGSRANAPYGVAAAAIIYDMGQWPTANPPTTLLHGNKPIPCLASATETPPVGICEYDNIDIAFQETTSSLSNIGAGWVSWAQILSSGVSNPQYITFPSYAIDQKGVRLTNPNPPSTAAAVATALWDFIDLPTPNIQDSFFTQTGDTWNEWLAIKGYGDLTDPNPGTYCRSLQSGRLKKK